MIQAIKDLWDMVRFGKPEAMKQRRARRKVLIDDAEVWKPLPPGEVRTNAGQYCDMLKGPCACGAWH